MSPTKNDQTATWICQELSRLLGLTTTEDVAQYLMSMESSRDVEDYLQSMLDLSHPDHRKFVEMLLKRLGHSHITPSSTATSKHVATSSHKSRDKDQKQDTSPKHEPVQPKKNKTKQINLFSKEGQLKESVLLPGQHKCECQASKHPLVRNCLDCGRVICAQEGPGPCIFCTGNKLEKAAKASEDLPPQRMKPGSRRFLDGTNPLPDKAFTTALAHKERLLEFDRSSEHRTRVIDDESDYYNVDGNKWLAPKQRDMLRAKEQELREKRHGSKRGIQVTLDFAGRQVIEERGNFDELYLEPQFEEDSKEYYDNYTVNPALTFPRPVYESSDDKATSRPTGEVKRIDSNSSRVQDVELQKMCDPGKCLSMHQPYASLLVAGIKKHEGRTWYSSHRGRLWIAATVQQPSSEEITRVETFYRAIYGQEDLAFPKHYPTGCLLGCVEVTNVLPQEEYRLEYPDGESESPFVFICSNPCELFTKFPVKGQHKIYKLDPGVHQTAKKSLRF